MKMISDLCQEFGEYMLQLTSELFLKKEQPRSLSEMEKRLRAILLKECSVVLSDQFSFLVHYEEG